MGDVSHSGDFEIAGVVENTKYRDETIPADEMFFLPMLQTESYTDARLVSYQTWALFIDGIQLRVAGRPQMRPRQRKVRYLHSVWFSTNFSVFGTK